MLVYEIRHLNLIIANFVTETDEETAKRVVKAVWKDPKSHILPEDELKEIIKILNCMGFKTYTCYYRRFEAEEDAQ